MTEGKAPADDAGVEYEHDTSRLDMVLERNLTVAKAEARREMVKLVLAGGTACAMIIGATAILAASVQVRVAQTERVVVTEPKIVEAPKVVEPKIVEVPKLIEPPPAATPLAPAESHPFDSMTGKSYAGRISSVTETDVCFSQPDWCTFPVNTTPAGKAILGKDGQPVRNPDVIYATSTMKTWVGREAWLASSPSDPDHLARFWSRDGDSLVLFVLRRRDRTSAPLGAAPSALRIRS